MGKVKKQLVEGIEEFSLEKEETEKTPEVPVKTVVLNNMAYSIARNYDGHWTVYSIPFNALTGDVGKLEIVQVEGDKGSAEDRFKVEVGKRLF